MQGRALVAIIRRLGTSQAMPKNKSSAKPASKHGKSAEDTKGAEQTTGAVYSTNTGTVAIRVRAKPGASESRITDVSDDSVGVQIAAPPVDGEANTELIRFLSKLLNLRKSDLSLEKGSRSKDKVVLITAQVNVSDVLSSLKKQIGI
ncbi:hypothetical protein MRX96_046484 [Rhipicephalus microplus]|uniref:UPF0235 protein C15orf40 homolog n=1 Tax=Rhipicephalus microplus TaxID=6941 RepID=UPI003F6D5784